MRNSLLLTGPRNRFFLFTALTLLAVPLIVGCGGGGGSSSGGNNGGNNGGNGGSNLPTVTGRILDFSNNGVGNATVTITAGGVTRTVQTNADASNQATLGTFTITNVPVAARSFLVIAPTGTGYFNVVQYGGKNYETQGTRICPLPLPTLQNNVTSSVGTVTIFGTLSSSAVGSPPPPPTGGCP